MKTFNQLKSEVIKTKKGEKVYEKEMKRLKKRRQFCSCYDEGIIEGAKEYRQFILNVLDGIDIADKELGGGGTKAIRLAIKSRII